MSDFERQIAEALCAPHRYAPEVWREGEVKACGACRAYAPRVAAAIEAGAAEAVAYTGASELVKAAVEWMREHAIDVLRTEVPA